MSWYSDGEPFDEWDDPYCERIRCEGGESYEQCKRCLARVYGNAGDEEQEEPMLCEQPYGELGRYLTYYAEDRLYLVFGLITMYIIIRVTERSEKP